MTAGSVERAPILVLAVGNQLLSDDGVGLVLIEELEREMRTGSVEFLDGGTQGLALLGYLSGRQALLILDAVALSSPPGTVHVLSAARLPSWTPTSSSAHESSAVELVRYAQLLGDLPENTTIVGIEPAAIATGIGLSSVVANAIPNAKRLSLDFLESNRAVTGRERAVTEP
jgi:hydrogenase maturation protease